MNKNDGGPAFPCEDLIRRDDQGKLHGYEISSPGMTLRDYFAGKVLAGELAAEDMGEGALMKRSKENAKLMAERAYQMADAMIAARDA